MDPECASLAAQSTTKGFERFTIRKYPMDSPHGSINILDRNTVIAEYEKRLQQRLIQTFMSFMRGPLDHCATLRSRSSVLKNSEAWTPKTRSLCLPRATTFSIGHKIFASIIYISIYAYKHKKRKHTGPP